MKVSGPSASPRHWYESEEVLFALGVAAWLVVVLLKWPTALSFGDEIGYLGQAKLFLAGKIRMIPGAPGIWNPTPVGVPVSQYPLLPSLILAVLFAIAPGAIFLIGVLPAVALAWTGSRIFKAWGASPCWGLIFLAHPTVVVLARTTMSDVLLASLALGAWWSLRQQRTALAVVLLAAVMAARATGVPIAGAIIVGEVFESRRRAPDAGAAAATIRAGIIGFALGLILVLTSNALETGTPMFGYNYRPGVPYFRPHYFLTSAPRHLRSLLLNPPLLLLGVIPLWRRRMVGPLLVVAGILTMMCFYCFVDWAPGWFESLVVAERLVLPAVTFLLLGYVAGLSPIVERFRLVKVANLVLMVAPAVIAWQVSARHYLWQRPMREAREAAVELLHQVGGQAADGDQLGLTYASSKAGLLYPGRTSWIVKDGPRPAVLLCSTTWNSYRDFPGHLENDRCDATTHPGYRPLLPMEGFVVMLREGIVAPPLQR